MRTYGYGPEADLVLAREPNRIVRWSLEYAGRFEAEWGSQTDGERITLLEPALPGERVSVVVTLRREPARPSEGHVTIEHHEPIDCSGVPAHGVERTRALIRATSAAASRAREWAQQALLDRDARLAGAHHAR